MSTKHHLPLLGLLFLLFAGCGKEELDPAELVHNPFDAEYAGADLFLLDTAYTSIWVDNNGMLHRQLIARVRVRVDLFTNNASFRVRSELLGGGGAEAILQPDAQNRVVLPVVDGVSNGEVYGWQLNVKSGVGLGGGNTVQVTVQ